MLAQTFAQTLACCGRKIASCNFHEADRTGGKVFSKKRREKAKIVLNLQETLSLSICLTPAPHPLGRRWKLVYVCGASPAPQTLTNDTRARALINSEPPVGPSSSAPLDIAQMLSTRTPFELGHQLEAKMAKITFAAPKLWKFLVGERVEIVQVHANLPDACRRASSTATPRVFLSPDSCSFSVL